MYDQGYERLVWKDCLKAYDRLNYGIRYRRREHITASK